MKWLGSLFVVASVATSWMACQKKEHKSDSSDTQETSEAGTIALTSDLASSYPEGLTVTAFPQAVDESPGTAAPGTVAVSQTSLALIVPCPPPPEPSIDGCTPPSNNTSTSGDGDFKPFAEHPKDRLEDAMKRLDGSADNCFSDDIIAAMFRQINIADACYGFDYGMVSGVAMGDVDPGLVNSTIADVTDQSLDGVKSALASIDSLTPDTSSEACMVKVGRQMIDKTASRVEGTLQVFEGMLCQAKKDKIVDELPTVGESVDLKQAFANYDRATFSEASVTRLADRDGRPVYRSKLAFTVKGGVAAGKEMTVNLVHSPGADDNVEYDGVMWYEGERVGQNTSGNYTTVTSIAYSKSGATVADQRLKMEVRAADFNKDKVTAAFISEDGTIDLNPGVDDTGRFGAGNQNDYVEGIRYFAFDINPSSYAGNISFWTNPGGTYEEAARGFVFESSQNDDGTLSGCAYSGAARGLSIRKAIREDLTLEPTGCFTPQLSFGACGSAGDNQGPQIWKQCFSQSADSGYYLVDSTKADEDRGFEIIDLGTANPTLPTVERPIENVVGDVRD